MLQGTLFLTLEILHFPWRENDFVVQHVMCQRSDADLSSMKFKERKVAMRKDFIAKVCHHRWNGIRMGRGRGTEGRYPEKHNGNEQGARDENELSIFK